MSLVYSFGYIALYESLINDLLIQGKDHHWIYLILAITNL